MGGAQCTEGFDAAATVGRGFFDIGDLRYRLASRGKSRADFVRDRRDAKIGVAASRGRPGPDSV
jgi:hypothetical protein